MSIGVCLTVVACLLMLMQTGLFHWGPEQAPIWLSALILSIATYSTHTSGQGLLLSASTLFMLMYSF